MSRFAWIEEITQTPEITDLCINGTQGVFIDRGSGMEPFECGPTPTEAELRQWVLELLSAHGKSWDARYPFVDCALNSGFRLHAIFPPLARNGITVSLRKNSKARERRFWADSPGYEKLKSALTSAQTLLIAGATGSGKTTLASELLSELHTGLRIIALEDTAELAPEHPHFVTLVSRPSNADGFGEITLRDLLKQSLRMRPDRIILGECRGDEVLELLQTLNTGHAGSLATIHANSCRDALRRVELLCLLAARGQIPVTVIRELVSSGIQWIAHVARVPNGERSIHEICRVEGIEGGVILLRPCPVTEASRTPALLMTK